MTIPVSTVPAAIGVLTSNIETQVAADPSPSAILVVIGKESSDSPDDLIIVATNVQRRVTEQTFRGDLGDEALKEGYTIDVLCSSWTGDPDPVANMNRAWVLAGYVERAARVDPELGGLVRIARPSGSSGGQSTWTVDDHDNPTGRLTEITVGIYIETLN